MTTGSAKVDTLLQHLEEVLDEGHKALVFSQFTSLLSIVRAHLDPQGVDYEYLDGRTRRRQEKVDRFHQRIGEPPMTYLANWRMQIAADMLVRSDNSMLAIADAVGYRSEAAFRNAFAKHFGQPPARYRRQAR